MKHLLAFNLILFGIGCTKWNDAKPPDMVYIQNVSFQYTGGSVTGNLEANILFYLHDDSLWMFASNAKCSLSTKLISRNITDSTYVYGMNSTITNPFGYSMGQVSSLQLTFFSFSGNEVSGWFEGSISDVNGSSTAQVVNGNFYEVPVTPCSPNQ
jgi:hypothetical protein